MCIPIERTQLVGSSRNRICSSSIRHVQPFQISQENTYAQRVTAVSNWFFATDIWWWVWSYFLFAFLSCHHLFLGISFLRSARMSLNVFIDNTHTQTDAKRRNGCSWVRTKKLLEWKPKIIEPPLRVNQTCTRVATREKRRRREAHVANSARPMQRRPRNVVLQSATLLLHR